MTEPKTIALDFDETYTADPELWDEFIRLAQGRGHRVICVTCRRNTLENAEIVDLPIPVFFTSHGSKLEHMYRVGVKVDIWLDDDPACVIHGK